MKIFERTTPLRALGNQLAVAILSWVLLLSPARVTGIWWWVAIALTVFLQLNLFVNYYYFLRDWNRKRAESV